MLQSFLKTPFAPLSCPFSAHSLLLALLPARRSHTVTAPDNASPPVQNTHVAASVHPLPNPPPPSPNTHTHTPHTHTLQQQSCLGGIDRGYGKASSFANKDKDNAAGAGPEGENGGQESQGESAEVAPQPVVLEQVCRWVGGLCVPVSVCACTYRGGKTPRVSAPLAPKLMVLEKVYMWVCSVHVYARLCAVPAG